MEITNVVAYSKDGEEEKELEEVRQLMERQMEPLSTTSSYTQFNKLIPLGIPGWSQESENKEVADMFSTSASSEHLNNILESLQNHMNKCAADISMQQNRLLLRCKNLDDTAALVTKKMTQSLNHAIVTADKIAQVSALSKHSQSVKANFGTVMRRLQEIESVLIKRQVVDADILDTLSRWPLLKALKSQSAEDNSDDRVYIQPLPSPQTITDSHFAYSNSISNQTSTATNKPSLSSMPLSKASLLPSSSQSRPTIVRTTTSHSSLAATHQLKELAAVADKQEERLKLSKHNTK